MALRFITRTDQNATFGILQFQPGATISDAILDGEEIQKHTYTKHWKRESDVHSTTLLSSTVQSTRNLLGQQQNLVRDEIRLKSWAAYIEDNGKLVLAEITAGDISKTIVVEQNAWRSHLALDKYTGHVHVVAVYINGQKSCLSFNGIDLQTAAEQPDFPFFSLEQVPIGHVPLSPPKYGLLTYKCRQSGQCFGRHFDGERFGDEYIIDAPVSVGGISFSLCQENVVALLYRINGDHVVPTIARSDDRGHTFSEFEELELPYGEEFVAVPFADAPTQDHHGFIHIPIGVTDGRIAKLVNIVVDEAIVEAIDQEGDLRRSGHVGIQAFPKTSDCRTKLLYAAASDAEVQSLRYGDGQTDGVGLIGTLLARGSLHTSNSQSSGISFPKSAHLNHEMPKIAAFRASQCYTRGQTPNSVSMDYLYLEASEDGVPLGSELHFETWDMPLPIPTVSARADGDKIHVQIEKDANFRPGETLFYIDNPAVEILEVEFRDVRHAILTTNSHQLSGATVNFEVRSLFYHHAATTVIQ